jgi:threonine dehydrogenase-like Zn-dependent dehydrogenase
MTRTMKRRARIIQWALCAGPSSATSKRCWICSADGRLDVQPLISHRFGLEQTEAAYAVVGGSEPSMGILLEYPTRSEKADSVLREPTVRMAAQAVSRPKAADPAVAFVGSGNYATGVLIPAFKAAGAHLASVASSAGVSGVHAAKKYGFDETTTDTDSLFADPKVDALVITTRHNSHAGFVLQALRRASMSLWKSRYA